MDDSCCNKEICENCIHSAYYLSKRICLLKDKLVNDEDPKCDDFKNGYFVGIKNWSKLAKKNTENE